jgi:signal transduction histidine kinase/ActR/RegA family two-component response regulator
VSERTRGQEATNAELRAEIGEYERGERRLIADHATLKRVHDLSERPVREDDLSTQLQGVIDAAIDILQAHMGALQLYDEASRSLRIVAQRGLKQPFLDHFAVVHEEAPVCGEALRQRIRVIVEDVSESPIVGTPTMAVMEAAGVRAVQSTFFGSRNGGLLGTITTYWTEPHRPEESGLRMLDLLAREAADIVEHRQQVEALRESEQRLRAANRHKDEFMAALSHELRNPLAPIRNSLYILERAAPGGEKARQALAVIDRQVAQLTHIVDDLLDVTRVVHGKIHLKRERLELDELVRRVWEDHRSLFDRAEVGVELGLAPEPVFVDADSNRLAQVVSNLLQNAVKFADRGGRVSVSVASEREARRAVIRVADTGIGMAPETIDRLFQPFAQADRSLDRARGGLGLGLALVKGVVELHGGAVYARSDGLGRGAEFVVRLPLAEAPWASSDPGRPSAGAPRRVLIIEDDLDAADSLRDVLECGGHEVEVAYNGPQGLANARQFQPEVVLCDIGLPGMDGFEVAQAFRADDAFKGVCLVALAVTLSPETWKGRGRAAGFQRHLAKPPSPEALEALLAELAANRRGLQVNAVAEDARGAAERG